MVSKVSIAIVLLVAMFALISEARPSSYGRGFHSGFVRGEIAATRAIAAYSALEFELGLGLGAPLVAPAGVIVG